MIYNTKSCRITNLKIEKENLKMEKIKERFIDEKTGIQYIKCGDYYLPNLVMPKENTNYQIGKYGRMKLNYLKSYKS